MNRYYIADGTERKGPFDLDELRDGGAALAPDTLVWSQGMEDWLPAERVPELAPLLGRGMPAPAAAAAPPTDYADYPAGSDDFLVANPRLPRMAQAICVYTIVINPALYLLSTFSCLATRPWDDPSPSAGPMLLLHFVSTLLTLGIAILLLVGGLKLRALKRSGATVLKVGFSLSLAALVCAVAAAVAVGVAYGAGEPEPARSPSAGDVMDAFMLTLTCLAAAAELVALIWLVRRRDRLPLI